MAHRRRHLITLAAVLLFTRGGTAAVERRGEQDVTFTVFSAEPISGLSYQPTSKAAAIPLSFYPTARSPRYSYHGSNPMQFLEAATGRVVAEATVAPTVRTALLIFSPGRVGGRGAENYRVQVWDDSGLQHGEGTVLILNLSGLDLLGTINHRPLGLNAGYNAPITVGSTATISLRTPYKNRSYQAYTEVISLEAGGRGLLLLLPPYRAGSLEVQSRVLLDVPAPKPGMGPK